VVKPLVRQIEGEVSLCAYVKLEGLKISAGLNHFALKSKIYLSASQTAYSEVSSSNRSL
jgi:hypothetical protein